MRERHQAGPLCATVIALSIATSVLGATVHGKVVLWNTPVANAVVAIDDIRIDTPDPPIQVIDHRDLKLTPRVVVVPVGTTIRFANSDGMPCHLYSSSRTTSFVLRPEDGGPRTLRLGRPGVVELFCAEHANAHAFIVVRENPYYGLTDGTGTYHIANLPPGRYHVFLWYEGKASERRDVNVDCGDMEIDFESSPLPADDADPPSQFHFQETEKCHD